MLIRPCRSSDLAGIEKVVNENQARISSIPRDREKLSERIDHAVRSFAQDPSITGSEFFLFVMENTDTNEVVGTSGISMNADISRPFYSYRIDELIHSSPKLSVQNLVQILHLTHELTGKAVLSSLSIKDDYRDTDHFELLSRSRLMFVQQFREWFSNELVVELQGVLSENDSSAFWDSLGRHFFNMDFATADHYFGIKSRTTIAEMMPPHPIYVQLLSDEAKEVIAEADPRAERNYRLLQEEGFEKSRYIDIFDGGPTLIGSIGNLRTVQNIKQKPLLRSDLDSGETYLVANTSFEGFRCVMAQTEDQPEGALRLNSPFVESLQLNEGDNATYVKL